MWTFGKTIKPVNSKRTFTCQDCVSPCVFYFCIILDMPATCCYLLHISCVFGRKITMQLYNHHHQPFIPGPPPAQSGHPGLAWQTLPLPWPLASRALGGGCSCVAIKHAVSIQSAPLTMCQQHGSIEPPRPRPSPRPGGRGPQR